MEGDENQVGDLFALGPVVRISLGHVGDGVQVQGAMAVEQPLAMLLGEGSGLVLAYRMGTD